MSDDMIKRLRDMMYRVSRNDAEKLGEIIAALDASTLAMSEANAALEAANARIAELESERDALLAAAGKEAVVERPFRQGSGFEPESYDEFVRRTERTRKKFTYGAFTPTSEGTEKAREFLIGYMRSGMGNGIYDKFIRYELAGDFAWNLANGLAAALAQPLEAQADELSLRAQYEDACIQANKNAQDAARLDWLDKNMFRREMNEWDTRIHHGETMWVTFAPSGVQGSARKIIDAVLSQKAGEQDD